MGQLITTNKIVYKKGSKYNLDVDFMLDLKYVVPGGDKGINEDFVYLSPRGSLIVYKGWDWDGGSGPAIDTKNIMRASLVHDALYWLMRQGRLDQSFRKAADMEFRRLCLEDGMSSARAWWLYYGLRFGAAWAAGKDFDKVFTAP